MLKFLLPCYSIHTSSSLDCVQRTCSCHQSCTSYTAFAWLLNGNNLPVLPINWLIMAEGLLRAP